MSVTVHNKNTSTNHSKSSSFSKNKSAKELLMNTFVKLQCDHTLFLQATKYSKYSKLHVISKV